MYQTKATNLLPSFLKLALFGVFLHRGNYMPTLCGTLAYIMYLSCISLRPSLILPSYRTDLQVVTFSGFPTEMSDNFTSHDDDKLELCNILQIIRNHTDKLMSVDQYLVQEFPIESKLNFDFLFT
jgi:hypothetical protein